MFPLNLPNALTLIRILLVPVLVVALTVETPGGSTIAAIVFAIAALTDGLDGYIARSRQSVTTFGKVMDPVADKLMIAAALISLVSLERVAAWVAMVVIAREFAVSGLRIAAGQQGVVIPATGLGKVKTIVQVAAVLALIAANDYHDAWVQALVYAMVVITVVSGADYFLNFRRRLEEASRERADAGLVPLRGSSREALDELLAARPAQVERAVEALAVDVEDGEQDVRGADAVGVAGFRELTGAVGHVVEHVGAKVGALIAVRVLAPAGHERGLADAERLQDRAHLAVEPHGAQPALGLVLGGVGEWDGRARESHHEGGVLRERDIPAVVQDWPPDRMRTSTDSIGQMSDSLTPRTGDTTALRPTRATRAWSRGARRGRPRGSRG